MRGSAPWEFPASSNASEGTQRDVLSVSACGRARPVSSRPHWDAAISAEQQAATPHGASQAMQQSQRREQEPGAAPREDPVKTSLPPDRGTRTWGNTISSWQFGIYRDPPASLLSARSSAGASAGSACVARGAGSGSARLRCCVAAAMAGVTALLVGVMVLEAAGTRNGQSRDQEVVRRLMRLQAATAASAPPSAPNASMPAPTRPPPPSPSAASRDSSSERDAMLPTPPTPAPSPPPNINATTVAPAITPAPPTIAASTAPHPAPDNDSADAPIAQPFFFAEAPERRNPDAAGRRGSQPTTPPPPRPPRPFLRPPPPPLPHRNGVPHHLLQKQHQQPVVAQPVAAESRPYAQLSPYRYPTDAHNIQDIIKYLTAARGIAHAATHPAGQDPGHFLATPAQAIKFSGIYLKPRFEEPQEAGTGAGAGAASSEERPRRRQRRPTLLPAAGAASLNGHAYIADPFHAFKPSDPGQVNLLADSDLRFAPAERQTPPRPSTDIYFPRPPLDFGPGATAATTTARPALAAAPAPDHSHALDHAGGITSAIYRPLGVLAAASSGADGGGGGGSRGLAGGGGGGVLSGRRRARPFSLMLDIYPMPPAEHAAAAAANIHPRRPRPYPAATAPAPAQGSPAGAHHMVVHLNLYPRVRSGARSNSRSDGAEFGVLAELSGPTFHVSVRPGGGRGGGDYVQGDGGGAWAAADWAELLAQFTGRAFGSAWGDGDGDGDDIGNQGPLSPRDLQERATHREHEFLTDSHERSAATVQEPWTPSQDGRIQLTGAEMDPSGPEHTAVVPSLPGLGPTSADHAAIDHTTMGRSIAAEHYDVHHLDSPPSSMEQVPFSAADPSGVASTIGPSNQLPPLEEEPHGYAP